MAEFVAQRDYLQRVYAGVLGKIIGVYLGRPFEGWIYERIMAELGEIRGYVAERLGLPLVVTDDDIAGTFTFLRALPDHGCRRTLTPAEIGETWLNYIVEGRTILWWGGLGVSSEHTAYLRLKNGVHAPQSGSIALNGPVIAQQIGGQIFIDGWGMVAPGDPELAASLAGRAASVAHDREAVYAAQVLAAMEAAAFCEPAIDRLLDTGVSVIPHDAAIYRLIAELRDWHAGAPGAGAPGAGDGGSGWRRARARLAAEYGYDKYPGNCPVIPNHALVMLGLLWGEGDFRESLAIANTSGWDTDCNSGNLGCLLGIRNGLAGLDTGYDFRGPVADRLYLSTADGGRCITDAVQEAGRIANYGRALAGAAEHWPKGGARFHFDLPGARQGFQATADGELPVALTNVAGHSLTGERALALAYGELATGQVARAATATFIPPDALAMPGYALMASPTLYPGQVIRAVVSTPADAAPGTHCALLVGYYNRQDRLEATSAAPVALQPGEYHELRWTAPDTAGAPIAEVGIQVTGGRPGRGEGGARAPDASARGGVVYLDLLSWEGTPSAVFRAPVGGTMWRRAWVNGVDVWDQHRREPYYLIQNAGTGLLIQGAREWAGYEAAARITPFLLRAGGLAAHVQGMRRYYALLLCEGGVVRLVKRREDEQVVLAEAALAWNAYQPYDLSLSISGRHISARVGDDLALDCEDEPGTALDGGAVALICREGCLAADWVAVHPYTWQRGQK